MQGGKCRGKRLYTNLRNIDAEIAKLNQPITDWPFAEYYLENYFNLLRQERKTHRYPVSYGSIHFAVSLW